jgi:hypothetical protein
VIAGDGSNANSNSSPTASAVGSAQPTTSDGALSADELYQLTLYKWRYSLEAFGFDDREVRELMFLKWLHTSRRVVP